MADSKPVPAGELTSTACPACGVRYAVYVREVFTAKPIGSFSLAGAQMKFSAIRSLVYECSLCGDTGPAGLK